jgi:hypothetical protein
MDKSKGKTYFAYFSCDPADGELTTYEEAINAARDSVSGPHSQGFAFVYECVPRAFVSKPDPHVEIISAAPAPKKRGRPRKKK